jgi:hypothetical protein
MWIEIVVSRRLGQDVCQLLSGVALAWLLGSSRGIDIEAGEILPVQLLVGEAPGDRFQWSESGHRT